MQLNKELLEKAARLTLRGIGESPSRAGLKDTPKRYAKMMAELTEQPNFAVTCFENEGEEHEMILVKDIPFYSLCEHHLLPFFGTAVVAYIPDKKIVGLSKLPRFVEYCAKGLQNQERVTQRIADFLMHNDELKPLGVAVFLQARHLCMEMRGVSKPGTTTETKVLRGLFKDSIEHKREFLFSIYK
jgi:GTP cyclohydrolase I